jgi:GH25 family lysozyme M1 (1,4-beta-N-acetylmuramidase)
MIAAIYARKSTEQTGTAEEGKSVTRQIDHARGYAAAKEWTVERPARWTIPVGGSGPSQWNETSEMIRLQAIPTRPAVLTAPPPGR